MGAFRRTVALVATGLLSAAGCRTLAEPTSDHPVPPPTQTWLNQIPGHPVKTVAGAMPPVVIPAIPAEKPAQATDLPPITSTEELAPRIEAPNWVGVVKPEAVMVEPASAVVPTASPDWSSVPASRRPVMRPPVIVTERGP